MGNLGDSFEIRHIVAGVSDGLQVDGLGTAIDSSGNVLCIVTLNEFGGDSKSREQDLELVVGATIQVAGGYDIIAGVSKCGDCHELGSLAGWSCNGRDTALKGSDAFFEDINSRLLEMGEIISTQTSLEPLQWASECSSTYVHYSTVDVAGFLEAKEPGTVCGVIESVGLGSDRIIVWVCILEG